MERRFCRCVGWFGLRPAQAWRARSDYLTLGLLMFAAGVFAPWMPAASLQDDEIASWIQGEGGSVTRDAAGQIIGVDLTSRWVTDADLERIARLPSLRRLDLSHTWVSDLGIEHLAPLENVTHLKLYYAEYITDAAIAHIKGWKNLEYLNVRGTKVTSRVFEHAAHLTKLKSLDVGFSRVTDDGFENLAALTELEELSFGGNKMSGVSLTLLKLLPALRRLDMGGLQRTDSGLWGVALSDFNMDALEVLSDLRVLSLSATGISDLGLAKLGNMKALESLDLSQTSVSSRGTEILTRLPRLRRLKLWRAERIDDQAAIHFARIEHLESLDLAATAITDETLDRLASIRTLKKVFVGSTQVTEEAVGRFRESHPGIEVSWWVEPPAPANVEDDESP